MSTSLIYPTNDGLARSHALLSEIVKSALDLIRDLSNPYRPEQHYMRGPGPKWRARQRVASVASAVHSE
jgi:hypothetical protein